MKLNMGTVDRVIRGLIAVAIGVLYIMGYLEGWVAIAGGVVALIMLFTSVSGFCPLYKPFNLTTKK